MMSRLMRIGTRLRKRLKTTLESKRQLDKYLHFVFMVSKYTKTVLNTPILKLYF